MHISDIQEMQKEKDHQMRYGHLSAKDRELISTHRMYRDMRAHGYHSPEKEPNYDGDEAA